MEEREEAMEAPVKRHRPILGTRWSVAWWKLVTAMEEREEASEAPVKRHRSKEECFSKKAPLGLRWWEETSQKKSTLEEVKMREENGKLELFVPKSTHDKLKAPFRFSAIATLSGGRTRTRLDYGFIFSALRALGAGLGSTKFSSVGKGLFLIRASSEADLQSILTPGRWKIGGRLLIANRWLPRMPLRIEPSNRVRIWVRMPELPPELWKNGIFQRLADMMGATFVEADSFTKEVASLGFVRVQLEVPLGFIPVNKVRIAFEGGDVLVQSIEYESKVKYCLRCGATSHFTFACQELKQAPPADLASADGGKEWLTVKSPKWRTFTQTKKHGQDDKANRFSALHNLSGKLEDRMVPVEQTCPQQSTDLTRVITKEQELNASSQEKEASSTGTEKACLQSQPHDHPVDKMKDTASVHHGINKEDSTMMEVANEEPSCGVLPIRKIHMEKKRLLKSKSTSMFKKRSNAPPQLGKLPPALSYASTAPDLPLPQAMEHSGFGAAETRASSVAIDPGDQNMRDAVPSEENQSGIKDNNNPHRDYMGGCNSVKSHSGLP